MFWNAFFVVEGDCMKRSLLRDFTRYVGFNIFGMIGISGYILADTFFVARALGATGLAALNLSIPIYSVIHGAGLMLGIGGATRFSILKSREQEEGAGRAFSTAMKTGLFTGILLAVLGLAGSTWLAHLMGADEHTLPLTATYLTTILSFAPFFMLNNILLAFIRNDGNPNLSMIAMLTGSFSNILLDYLFMFPLGMGMFGAAFATGLAPIISMGVLLLHFRKNKDFLNGLKHRISWKLIPDLCNLGLSSLVMEIASAVVLITFNLVILSLEGNLGVAAYGIVANLALMATGILTGLAQGIQPLVSMYHGANDEARTAAVRKYALQTALLLAALVYGTTFIYTDEIVALFNSEANIRVAQMAQQGLRTYFVGFFFAGLNIVTATFYSATEDARSAFIISILRGFVLIVPLVVVFGMVWNMAGVWLAFVFTELMVTLSTVYLERERAIREEMVRV